jgi:predicted HicB family RNase H-like nuclease
MASYILRDIDADLWRRVKSKAALEGVSVKKLIEQLLRTWVDADSAVRSGS